MVDCLAYSAGVVPPRNDLRREEGGELLNVEQLVAYPAVEALDERVLHGELGSM
jgi:hypothetical protein